MKKEKSTTRREYESVYKWLRIGVDSDWFAEYSIFQRSVIKAAEYSHEAYYHNPCGWTSRRRASHFYYLKRSKANQEERPF